jgi:MFS family permease
MGIGMILGAILAGAFAQKIGLTRTLWLSLLGMALLITGYARSTDIWVAIILIGVAGIPQAALNVAAGPLLLQSTPREMVGRVSSILNPTITISTLVGAALGGYLDSTVMRDFSATLLGIFTAAGLIALVGALFAAFSLWGVKSHASAPEPAGVEAAPVEVSLTPLAAETEEPVLG